MKYSGKSYRVLHVTFNMGIGGTEQVIRQLVTHLPQNEFVSEVLCIDGTIGEIGRQLQKNGVEVQAFRRKKGIDLKLAIRLRRMIRDQKIDILHCHQYTPWFYGWLATRGTRARLVFTEHGRFYPDQYRYKAIFANPVMALFTDTVVAISAATRRALSRYEFIPAAKIRVIYNGIQSLDGAGAQSNGVRSRLNIPVEAFVLGTVARLDPVKNQSMMLEAFAQLCIRYPDVWLLMVGDGPDRQQLEALSSELGIAERVIFTGFQSEPAPYLATMDLFLLSSHTEGTSMTLLEAMSLGIPVVATAVGGNPEIVADGDTGYLVRPGDSESLASAVVTYRERAIDTESFAEACRNRFHERFSVETMVEAYAACYRSLL